MQKYWYLMPAILYKNPLTITTISPIGVLEGLKRQFDLSHVPLLGSSSGAFAASLTASGACLHGASLKGAELFVELGIAKRLVRLAST